VAAAHSNRFDHIFSVARHHYTNGNLAVIRGISGVERAAAVLEVDFATHAGLQLGT
jgi:hypothetical protein